MNKHDWGLVNQKYIAIKEEQPDLMAEMREDLEFYRKRIYQATKELSKNSFDNKQHAIKDAFIHYATLLIEHFKLEDIKELMSEQLDTILEESEEDTDMVTNEPQTADEITKQFLVRGEKPSIIRIEDCFNVIKTSTSETFTPKRSRSVAIPSINIRQDKFREKGVKKRPDNKILQADNKILQADNKILQADNKILQADNKILQENIKNEAIIYETNPQTDSQTSTQENS
jgi:hypothetical protein